MADTGLQASGTAQNILLANIKPHEFTIVFLDQRHMHQSDAAHLLRWQVLFLSLAAVCSTLSAHTFAKARISTDLMLHVTTIM